MSLYRKPRPAVWKSACDDDGPRPALLPGGGRAREQAAHRGSREGATSAGAEARPGSGTRRAFAARGRRRRARRAAVPGKLQSPEDIDEATPTLDDETRHYRHHPSDAGTTEFGFNPDAADAAADLAGDLGSGLPEGATRGEDISDVAASRDVDADDLPLVLDESGDEVVDDEGAQHAIRARPFEEPGALGQSSSAHARPEAAGQSRARRGAR